METVEWTRRMIGPDATFDDVLMALVELPPEIAKKHAVANLVFCGVHKPNAVKVITSMLETIKNQVSQGGSDIYKVVKGFVSPDIAAVPGAPDGFQDCSSAVMEAADGEFEFHFSAVEAEEA